ncbi:T9SS type A sorting domain-containing protein [Rubrivirga sp. IMCC45206]|uniref:T9SS type A sorting domain-containing protein n=1 Tax=Rubrivirga sp. IMCC45206 TaxID=3391614 RepID=UPI00398FD359
MTRFFQPALVVVLAVAFAAAPDAQRRPVDADPGGQSAPPVTNAGPDVDDRDPGYAPPFRPRPPGPAIDDRDDPASTIALAEHRSFHEARTETNGRTVDSARQASLRVVAPYDGPLIDGRTAESAALAEARMLTAAPYDGPLDNGRPAGVRPGPVVEDVAPDVLTPEVAASRAAESFGLSVVTPNPASDRAAVTVVSDALAEATVTLYDVQGREVARAFDGVVQPSSPARVDLDLAGLAPGTYVVVLRIGDARQSQTVQVVR